MGSKTAVVTGAASGIGRAIAEKLFIQKNYDLFLIDKDQAGLQALQTELTAARRSQSVRTLSCDLVHSSSVSQILEALGEQPIDVLVNSAGKAFVGEFEKMPASEIDSIIAVNLTAVLSLTRALLPRLLRTERPSIVNIASLAGLVGAPGISAYSATKFALVGFSEALASELRGRAHVCVVCPSFVKTNLLNALSKEDGVSDSEFGEKLTMFRKLVDRTAASPEKVADAVIKAIAKKEEFVLLNGDTYLFYYLHRLSPDLCNRLVHETKKRLFSRWTK